MVIYDKNISKIGIYFKKNHYKFGSIQLKNFEINFSN